MNTKAESRKKDEAILTILEDEVRVIKERIQFCQMLLGHISDVDTQASESAAEPKVESDGAHRYLSAAARRRIGAAQKKRWAQHRALARAAAKEARGTA